MTRLRTNRSHGSGSPAECTTILDASISAATNVLPSFLHQRWASRLRQMLHLLVEEQATISQFKVCQPDTKIVGMCTSAGDDAVWSTCYMRASTYESSLIDYDFDAPCGEASGTSPWLPINKQTLGLLDSQDATRLPPDRHVSLQAGHLHHLLQCLHI